LEKEKETNQILKTCLQNMLCFQLNLF